MIISGDRSYGARNRSAHRGCGLHLDESGASQAAHIETEISIADDVACKPWIGHPLLFAAAPVLMPISGAVRGVQGFVNVNSNMGS